MSDPSPSVMRLPAVLGVVWAALCLAVPVPVAAESAQEHFAHRHRDLDATERALALEIAREPAQSELRRRAGRAPGAPERIEIFDVERHRSAKDARPADYRRRADVYVYDYGSDQLLSAVVDLDSRRIESLTVAPSVQRPLSDREVAHALDLVFADPVSGPRIRAEFARIAGHPLEDRRDLEVDGFVYRADSMPNANTADSAACGKHRCAQLLISTHDSVSLEISIVDLSRERVLEPHGFGPPPAAPAPDADAHAAPHKDAQKPTGAVRPVPRVPATAPASAPATAPGANSSAPAATVAR